MEKPMVDKKRIHYFIEGGVIAALYAVLTYALAPISYGPVQIRVAEALCILPFFTPAAVPGLFLGCVIANALGYYGIWDIVIGSLATLIAAAITSKIKIKWLVPLPTVVVNAFIIGTMLYYLTNMPWLATVLWIALGEIGACYALGLPLLFILEKYKKQIFQLKSNKIE
jgi:uncharacterized membrane protein